MTLLSHPALPAVGARKLPVDLVQPHWLERRRGGMFLAPLLWMLGVFG